MCVGLQCPDLAFEVNEFGGRRGGSSDDIGGRQDLGTQVELLVLRGVQLADEVAAIDEVDAGLVGLLQSDQAAVDDVGDFAL